MTAEANVRPTAQTLWHAWTSGQPLDALGDPRKALTWMANEVVERGWPLPAGDIVLTGAAAPPIPVSAGDVVQAVFDGLGTATVRFTE